jgi:hypothetical protein
MVPISIITKWVTSVEYVSALSIYALIVGHLSTWSATKVEERQEEDQTEDIVKEIHENLECN